MKEPTVSLAAHNKKLTAIRLSIFHVMMWTACCAIGVAGRSSSESPGEVLFAIVSTFNALWEGTSVFGGIVLLHCMLRKLPALESPGSWLLAANAAETSILWTQRFSLQLAANFDFDLYFGYFAVIATAFSIGVIAFGMCLAYRMHERQAGWNAVFALSVVRYASLALYCLPAMVSTFGLIAASWFLLLLEFRLAMVAVTECSKSIPRSWIHWLGVAVTLASGPAAVAVPLVRFTI